MGDVSHPAYYNVGGIEVIDAITSWGFAEGFNRGNAIKYIARAGRKDKQTENQDLKKAIQYLEFEIDRLNAEHMEFEIDRLGNEEHMESEYPTWQQWLESTPFIDLIECDGAMCYSSLNWGDRIPADFAQRHGIKPKE